MNDEPQIPLSKDKRGQGKYVLRATCGLPGCKGAGTYSLKAKCSNCKWTGTVVQTVGHMGYTFRCPTCGCEEVRRV